jgi:hypothetical protein
VENEEEADYLREKYGIRNGVYDMRGSLTKLQGSLEAGAGQQGRYRELGGGMRLRPWFRKDLCRQH